MKPVWAAIALACVWPALLGGQTPEVDEHPSPCGERRSRKPRIHLVLLIETGEE